VTHLTDVVVSRLKTTGSYFDETTPAFGIRVGRNRKTWIVMRGVQRQQVRVGHYPAMSLADARKEAKKLLAEEPTKHSNMTFAAARDEYKEAIKTKKPRAQRDYKRILDKYPLPKLGKTKLSEIKYEDDVVQLLILNGQRKGETANLRWPWLMTLPDWITKNGRQHTFPYGDMTAAIFEAIPRRNSTDLLFPSQGIPSRTGQQGPTASSTSPRWPARACTPSPI
jgi:integrase